MSSNPAEPLSVAYTNETYDVTQIETRRLTMGSVFFHREDDGRLMLSGFDEDRMGLVHLVASNVRFL